MFWSHNPFSYVCFILHPLYPHEIAFHWMLWNSVFVLFAFRKLITSVPTIIFCEAGVIYFIYSIDANTLYDTAFFPDFIYCFIIVLFFRIYFLWVHSFFIETLIRFPIITIQPLIFFSEVFQVSFQFPHSLHDSPPSPLQSLSQRETSFCNSPQDGALPGLSHLESIYMLSKPTPRGLSQETNAYQQYQSIAQKSEYYRKTKILPPPKKRLNYGT